MASSLNDACAHPIGYDPGRDNQACVSCPGRGRGNTLDEALLYFARLQVRSVAGPPIVGAGLVYLNSSPVIVIGRTWLAPSWFGNELPSKRSVIIFFASVDRIGAEVGDTSSTVD